MAIVPRKRLTPKLSDMLDHAYPQHDQPCRRIPYNNPKQLFDAMLLDAKDG